MKVYRVVFYVDGGRMDEYHLGIFSSRERAEEVGRRHKQQCEGGSSSSGNYEFHVYEHTVDVEMDPGDMES